MPQSLSRIYIHAIFSTKDRKPEILPQRRAELHDYIGGTLNALGCPVVVIGGMADHVHLLFCMSRTLSVSDVVKKVKANTTKWYKEKMGCEFSWQRGYAALSVSQSAVDNVKEYIMNQEEHHRKRTFMEEYRAFLKLYNIKYDENYVWD